MRILKPGDKIYLIMPPNKNEDYHYVEGAVDEIHNDVGHNKQNLTSINLDQIGVSNKSPRYLCIGDLNHICIKVSYELYNFTFINNKSSLYRLYTENELEQVKEDVNNLNDILKIKRAHKAMVQKYIDEKLENWNYRGEINV